MLMTKVRIRASGQVLDMVPDVARAMILGGTAEEVKAAQPKTETMAVAPIAEHAVASPQTPKKKRLFGKRRSA